MADTLTPHYNWVKPEVTQSAATWGAKQNGVFDQIDAQVFANEQATVPIGMGGLWFTPTPPDNYLIADGRLLDTTAYAALFAVYAYRFGGSGANFALPPLSLRIPIGAGTGYALAATGGEATHTLTVAELAAHPHPITDITHTHSASQGAHVHPDPGHTHGGYQDAHAHNLTRNPASNVSGGNVAAGSGWAFTDVDTDSQAPAVHITPAGTGLQAAQPAVTVNPVGTGLSTTQNAGGGAAHNNMPPYVAINFIVRYQ